MFEQILLDGQASVAAMAVAALPVAAGAAIAWLGVNYVWRLIARL